MRYAEPVAVRPAVSAKTPILVRIAGLDSLCLLLAFDYIGPMPEAAQSG